ncbi:hypothetical protein UlMin_006489 [Ulmus minor]
MKGSFAEELYSESLQLSKLELDPTSSSQSKVSDSHVSDWDDAWCEEGSLESSSDRKVDKVDSDLEREWQRRHDQFHSIGYRAGLFAGKEAAAQEGFNVGFKESVGVGCKWGIVRGITSALALLPDDLKEKLIETEEKRVEFQKLHESAQSLSTTDALRLFNDHITAKKVAEQGENTEVSSHEAHQQKSEQHNLESYSEELRSVLLESPAIEVHLM